MPAGALAANLSKANATVTATEADDRIIYETDTGTLFYDSNGSAVGGSVKFAVLTGNLGAHGGRFPGGVRPSA